MRKNNQRLHLQLKLAIAHFILPLHQRQHDAPRQQNPQPGQRVAEQGVGQQRFLAAYAAGKEFAEAGGSQRAQRNGALDVVSFR